MTDFMSYVSCAMQRKRIEATALELGWSVKPPMPGPLSLFAFRADGWRLNVGFGVGEDIAAVATNPCGLTWVRDTSTNPGGVEPWVVAVLRGEVCPECGEHEGHMDDCAGGAR